MAARFWVGGNSTWNGTASTKWATTSGGTGGQAVPTAADDVHFDANSGAGCTLAGTRVCRSITFSGYTGTFDFASAELDVGDASGGAVTFVSGMTIANTAGLLRLIGSTGGTLALTAAGKTLPAVEVGAGLTTTYALQDNLTVAGTGAPGPSAVTSYSLAITSGILNMNGHNISTPTFSLTGTLTKQLTMGSATLTISGGDPTAGLIPAFNWTTSNTTVSGASGTVAFTDVTTQQKSIITDAPVSASFNITITAGGTGIFSFSIGGTFNMGTLTMTGKKTIQVAHGAKIVCAWAVNGTSGNLASFVSDSPGTAWLLDCGTPGVQCDFVSITDSHPVAEPGGYYAGNHSTNGGGNTQWIFAAVPLVHRRPLTQAVQRAGNY